MVNLNVKSICSVDIDESEAFHILCKTLHMDFVLNEDTKFVVKKNEIGENCVYIQKNDGTYKLFDDRGDLFVALRNVAVSLYPNLSFRSDNYIYKESLNS